MGSKQVEGQGSPCPRCGFPTEIWEHDKITQKELSRPFYYSRWFYCRNSNCKTTMIMDERYKVVPVAAKVETWVNHDNYENWLSEEAHKAQIGPPPWD